MSTYKEAIIHILTYRADKMSCSELCKRLISDKLVKHSSEKYLTGGLSSTLRKMVKDNILEYDDSTKGPRGGYIYKLKKK